MRFRSCGAFWSALGLVICVLFSSAVFCEESEEPSVFVVALDRESPDQPSNLWSPTLYKISIPQAKITARKAIQPHGTPIYCRKMEKNRISVALAFGVASNGSTTGEPYPAIAKVMTIDTETMEVLDVVVTDAQNDNLYEPTKAEGDIYALAKQTGLSPGTLLNVSSDGKNLYLLSGYYDGKASLQVLERGSLREIFAIPLDAGARKLGPAPDCRNAVLINDQVLACVFEGESPLGHFAPAYVMIADLAARHIRFVSIGSNPARGLAH